MRVKFASLIGEKSFSVCVSVKNAYGPIRGLVGGGRGRLHLLPPEISPRARQFRAGRATASTGSRRSPPPSTTTICGSGSGARPHRPPAGSRLSQDRAGPPRPGRPGRRSRDVLVLVRAACSSFERLSARRAAVCGSNSLQNGAGGSRTPVPEQSAGRFYTRSRSFDLGLVSHERLRLTSP